MDLTTWIKRHNLSLKRIKGNVYEIAEVGKFLLLPERKAFFDKDLYFNLTDDEEEMADDKVINYFLFSFGNNFYYSSLKPQKHEEYNTVQYKVELNDFMYLGKVGNTYDYNSLGIHSEYELLNSAANVAKVVKKAKFLGQTALALCDKNTLGGTLAFQLACEKEGIKSIIGMTASVLSTGEANEFITQEVKLYVVNEIGWKNLLYINKIINVDNIEIREISESVLLTYGEGLICVFSYDNSILRDLRDQKQYKEKISKYGKAFYRVFYQFSSHSYTDDRHDTKVLEGFKHYLNNYSNKLEPVLIDDVHYLNQDDHRIKHILNNIAGVVLPESEDQHMKSGDESIERITPLFDLEKEYCGIEAMDLFQTMMDNNLFISECCDFKISTGTHKLPAFNYDISLDPDNIWEASEFESSDDLFLHLVSEGFERKILNRLPDKKHQLYMERMEEECSVIVQAGFSDYFLILWDIIKCEKEAGGLVGPGRGSVAGSLVAYLLDITEVDPIKFDLLFERFLNKTRVSGERAQSADALPDVDVDFESANRARVKEYISRKYGFDFVCSVGSYGRLKLKGALKDLGRVKGLGFDVINDITKDIDDQQEYSFLDIMAYAVESERFYNFVQKHNDIIESIRLILNQPKTASVHPSAVIIVPNRDKEGNPMNIYNWMPIKIVEGLLVTEWEGKYTDRGGFLKEDILSISQLDKFKYVLNLVQQHTGKTIDLNAISLKSKRTFKLFQKGYNEDVFQFNSFGMKSYSKEVKPDCFDDLIAMNALYRPGPMDSNAHKDFALIKHGKKEPEYDYGLEDVTKATSGLYAYQEQIMKAVHVLGGLSLSQADEVRTVMKKFDAKKMATFEEQFINGAIERGCPEDEAPAIWAKLKAFSGYGFNKSHAAAYSLISYWGQWLKANYPLQFWASAYHFATTDEVPYLMREMSKTSPETEIHTPDINISTKTFVPNPANNSIYWSLIQIKGLGNAVVDYILEERAKNGKYYSLEEFISRACSVKEDKKKGIEKVKSPVNKGHIVNLIIAGAFDDVEGIEKNDKKERRALLRKYYELRKESTKDTIIEDKASSKEYFWILLQRNLIGYGDINYLSILRHSKDIPKAEVAKYVDPQEFFTDKAVSGEKYSNAAMIAGFLVKVKENPKAGGFGILEIANNNEVMDVLIWSDGWSVLKDRVMGLQNKMIAITGWIAYDKFRNKNTMYCADNKRNNSKSKLYEL